MSKRPLPGLPILIVEDDEGTAELERRALARSGRPVRIVGEVQAALDILRHEDFAAVLLDYNLPDGDPWLILDACQARDPRIPVVIVTGMGNERVAAEALHRGVDEYLRKSESFWDQLPGIVDRVSRLANAETSLRKEQELLTESQRLARLGSWEWDIPANRVLWSEETYLLFGLTSSTFAASFEAYLEAIPPADRPRVQAVIQDARRSGKAYTVEHRILLPSGETRILLGHGRVFLDGAGTPVRMAGTVQDITDLRRSEETIRGYQDIVAQMQIGLLVFDLVDEADDESMIVTDINPTAQRIVNLSLEEVRGKRLVDLFPGAEIHALVAIYAEVARSGRPRELGEVVYGDERLAKATYQVKAFPLPGLQVGLLFDDVSESVRVRALKDEFVSLVSHELRTPLTSIRGGLGLALSGVLGELPPKAREMLDIASANCERLSRLINDILDIERMESGKLDLKIEAADMMVLVREALHENAPYADLHGVEFQLDAEVSKAMVQTDPDRFLQILGNLLSNAAKFSPANGRVSVGVTRMKEGWCLAVSDRGPGIPQAFRDSLFDKFTQAESSNIRTKGGSGLGLSIVKSLVDRLAGKLWFESEEGQGTTFFVWFPEFQG